MKSIKYFSALFIAVSALFCNGAEVAQRSSQTTVIDWSDKVVKQKGAVCGFHAVKNAVSLYKYLTGGLDRATALKHLQASEDSPLFPLAVWQTIVKAQDNLDGNAIDTLLTSGLIGLDRRRITVIPDVHSFDPTRLMFSQTDQLANFLQDLRAGSPCLHAFVLGNMNEVNQSYGHWVAVVVHADWTGQVTCHYADSVGSNQAARERFITSLQTHVLTIEADRLRIEKCMAECLHGSQVVVSNDGNYRRGLEILNEAYRRIVTAQLEQSPIFITEYLPTIKQRAQTIGEIGQLDSSTFVATLTSLEERFSQGREQERKLKKDAASAEQAAKEMDELFDGELAHFVGTVQTGNLQQIEQEYNALLSAWGHTADRIAALENARNSK